jgi:hypothetical protein
MHREQASRVVTDWMYDHPEKARLDRLWGAVRPELGALLPDGGTFGVSKSEGEAPTIQGVSGNGLFTVVVEAEDQDDGDPLPVIEVRRMPLGGDRVGITMTQRMMWTPLHRLRTWSFAAGPGFAPATVASRERLRDFGIALETPDVEAVARAACERVGWVVPGDAPQ